MTKKSDTLFNSIIQGVNKFYKNISYTDCLTSIETLPGILNNPEFRLGNFLSVIYCLWNGFIKDDLRYYDVNAWNTIFFINAFLRWAK